MSGDIFITISTYMNHNQVAEYLVDNGVSWSAEANAGLTMGSPLMVADTRAEFIVNCSGLTHLLFDQLVAIAFDWNANTYFVTFF